MEISLPQNIVKGTLSVPKKENKYIKAKIQKIKVSGLVHYQISLYTAQQVFHKNYLEEEVSDCIIDLFESFNNMELYTKDYIYSYRITSKNKLLTNKRKNKESFVEALEHNKEKKYILPINESIPVLIDLGIMTIDGKMVKAKYDKFKQINRFLEIIEDSIHAEEKLKIIDFGCGKSYLTFILYYYLVNIKKIKCEIIGLDLKEEAINQCNKISEKYGYSSNLKFYTGDISKFKELTDVNMIITLHACDTATDYALYHAINMKCKYIFSVPCCQHEINLQMDSKVNHFINKYGILKERYAALITDAIRANILQYYGYKTQVMEFVDIENSPKNLLIRAVLTNNSCNPKIKMEIEEQMKTLGIQQTLYNLLFV